MHDGISAWLRYRVARRARDWRVVESAPKSSSGRIRTLDRTKLNEQTAGSQSVMAIENLPGFKKARRRVEQLEEVSKLKSQLRPEYGRKSAARTECDNRLEEMLN